MGPFASDVIAHNMHMSSFKKCIGVLSSRLHAAESSDFNLLTYAMVHGSHLMAISKRKKSIEVS